MKTKNIQSTVTTLHRILTDKPDVASSSEIRKKAEAQAFESPELAREVAEFMAMGNRPVTQDTVHDALVEVTSRKFGAALTASHEVAAPWVAATVDLGNSLIQAHDVTTSWLKASVNFGNSLVALHDAATGV